MVTTTQRSRRARRLLAGLLLLDIPAALSLAPCGNRAVDRASPATTAFSSRGRLCDEWRVPLFDCRPGHRRRCFGGGPARVASTSRADEMLEASPSAGPEDVALDSSILPEAPSSAKCCDTGSTAVILNMNARSVTPQLASVACDAVGANNVFVTRTAEEAALAARTVVRGCPSVTTNGGERPTDGDDDGNDCQDPRRYSLVIPVGGDGTLSGWINTMVDEMLLFHKLEHAAEENDSTKKNETSDGKTAPMSVEEALRELPMVGYVPMGTGNGLGYVVGCKAGKHEEEASTEKSILSKINILGRMKRRKLERTRRVMTRLKEVGDALQEAERTQQSDIADALAGKCSVVEMPLMEVTHPSPDATSTTTSEEKGDLCFFGGAGFDSLMLHDFQAIKAWSRSSTSAPAFLKDALSSVAGYCVALVTKTLPQTLRHGTHKIHVEVTTTDEDTLWIDHRRGDFSEPAVAIGGSSGSRGRPEANGSDPDPEATAEATKANGGPRRHLIYSGTTGIIAAATTPYYGGGLRLFPYARLFPDKLQLRLGRISPLVGFLNIPKIFEGSYREKGERSFGCLDFVGRDFEVEVRGERYEEYERRKSEKDGNGGRTNGEKRRILRGFPFQHSGESMGIKERFRLRVVQEPVRFVSFLHPRVIVDD